MVTNKGNAHLDTLVQINSGKMANNINKSYKQDPRTQTHIHAHTHRHP